MHEVAEGGAEPQLTEPQEVPVGRRVPDQVLLRVSSECSEDPAHLEATTPHPKQIQSGAGFLSRLLQGSEGFDLQTLVLQARDLLDLVSLTPLEEGVELQKFEMLEKLPMSKVLICDGLVPSLPAVL
jgi:hypothetical protein